ncbi:hypothetical protein [Acidihalobacter ferrooxydans]|uniref:hypothetical protein n=1 Tax=Acidihalobacter ferrooxydans TaxID=1765967 RepID=UPI0012EC5386|nr:hypothetical protein [Acidihalobacter ferrooxydans]
MQEVADRPKPCAGGHDHRRFHRRLSGAPTLVKHSSTHTRADRVPLLRKASRAKAGLPLFTPVGYSFVLSTEGCMFPAAVLNAPRHWGMTKHEPGCFTTTTDLAGFLIPQGVFPQSTVIADRSVLL